MGRAERICMWIVALAALACSVITMIEGAKKPAKKAGDWLMIDGNGCMHCGGCGKVKVERWVLKETICSDDFETWCLKCFGEEQYEDVVRYVIRNDSIWESEMEDEFSINYVDY